ncbi:transmembrane gamma-carboxyglutamic acid protein 1 [Crotalus adamanteus]|uniref:Transmembrane gamma-carboxyglutamic acid protein 1 n=1 Tax=Crotalus adamanteus TaxID=8729 RepID=A0AAW1BIE6_CROAD
MDSVFLTEAKANSVLKRYPRANGLLEELKKGNIERECYEERCDKEEAREAFENDEKTAEFWKDYTSGLYGGNQAGQNCGRYTEGPMDFLAIPLSNFEPPPSYEEVAGERSTETNEFANHLDPPPQYEDIVNSISVPHVNIK